MDCRRCLPVIFAVFVAAGQSPDERTEFIEQVRTQALAFDDNLPNFICTQETRRSSQSNKPGAAWKDLDTLTIRLSYFGKKEDYRVVQVNGKPTDKALSQVKGWKTAGDFGSILRSIFRKKTEAKFEWQRLDEFHGRKVVVLGFHIDQSHSQFTSTSSSTFHSTTVKWAAEGTAYADAETRQVVRLTLNSADMPANQPVREIHIALDYAVQKIGDREYLLPARSVSETITKDDHRKSDTQFKDYKKFSAEAAITFGGEAK
jgi:hypothetical protein